MGKALTAEGLSSYSQRPQVTWSWAHPQFKGRLRAAAQAQNTTLMEGM